MAPTAARHVHGAGGGHRPRVAAAPPASLQITAVGGRLTLRGRLDGRSAFVLHDAVSGLLRAGQVCWTLDATHLEVGDHTGLRALVGCYQRALEHGCGVSVLGASPALRHALRRLRLEAHLLPGDVERFRAQGAPRR